MAAVLAPAVQVPMVRVVDRAVPGAAVEDPEVAPLVVAPAVEAATEVLHPFLFKARSTETCPRLQFFRFPIRLGPWRIPLRPSFLMAEPRLDWGCQVVVRLVRSPGECQTASTEDTMTT